MENEKFPIGMVNGNANTDGEEVDARNVVEVLYADMGG